MKQPRLRGGEIIGDTQRFNDNLEQRITTSDLC